MTPTKNDFWEVENLIHKLRSGAYDAILHVVGTSLDEKMSKRKREEYLAKEEIVRKVHIGKRGNPIAINPITYKGKDCYYTKLDGRPVYRPSREAIIDYLYLHYGGDALNHDHTVEYYFDRYIKDYVTENPNKEKTARNTKADYARFVNKELANMDVRDITPKYLTAYSKDLVRRLRLKISAFKNFKSLLNYVFCKAMEDAVIFHNPAKSVDNKACYALCDQSIISEYDYDAELLSEEEFSKIKLEAERRMKFSRRYGNSYFYFYDLMLGLHSEIGCRPSELCALKWGDIKAGADLHIHAEIDSEGTYQKYTKNEKGESKGGRLIPLTPNAQEILAELRKRQERAGISSEFLFCQKDGRYVVPGSYEEYVRNAFDKAGVSGKSSYAFRRTVNNRLEEAGFIPSERAYLLGHTPETNLKHYTNPRKNATLSKFRESFCQENTKRIPKNVIEFKSKKPKNREFSGF